MCWYWCKLALAVNVCCRPVDTCHIYSHSIYVRYYNILIYATYILLYAYIYRFGYCHCVSLSHHKFFSFVSKQKRLIWFSCWKKLKEDSRVIAIGGQRNIYRNCEIEIVKSKQLEFIRLLNDKTLNSLNWSIWKEKQCERKFRKCILWCTCPSLKNTL